jgi:tubulin beta
MFDSRSMLSDAGDIAMQGKILTASCLFRGKNLSAFEVETTIAKFKNKKESSFVEWIPDNMMNSICKVPAAWNPSEISGTFLCNSTLINQGFDHLLTNFDKMLRAKAYVHWYEAEGMSIDEFREAAYNVRDLVSEY